MIRMAFIYLTIINNTTFDISIKLETRKPSIKTFNIQSHGFDSCFVLYFKENFNEVTNQNIIIHELNEFNQLNASQSLELIKYGRTKKSICTRIRINGIARDLKFLRKVVVGFY
ncbi:hypothetical protein C2G38_2121755 [Gigaspora rosea]|uniref:Uncharacterized protein n=1 Tax=Gigaspora rosea TaxID=44941 RepID=A0A397U128_9GLOM|nr:hypothetical protein C2G38_2121755 [Gigaspora rosea]